MANIAPDNFYEYVNELRKQYEAIPQGEVPSRERQTKYINQPGNVGTVWYNPGDPLNQYGFTPSEIDFSNAQLTGTEAQKDAFGNVIGEAALYKTDGGTLVYDPKWDSLNAFRPDAPTSYDPSLIQYNFAGTPYIEPTKTATTYKYNGVDVPITQNDVFAIDPLTGKAYTTPGDYAWTTKVAPSSGGFADWATSNGWMVPLAMTGAAAASGAFGAGAAAAEGAGTAGSMDAYMASAGLNPGTFSGAGFTMPGAGYASMGDYMSQAGLDAGTNFNPSYASMNDYMAQAGLDAGKFQGANFQMPGMSIKDALTNANRIKNIGSALSGMSGGGPKGGLDLSKLASLLGGKGQESNDFLGQIKMNERPFLFDVPGQTTATEGMYDVSGSNKAIANALRKK
jgi:hypothetical protein